MIDIPRFAPLRITQRSGRPQRKDFDSCDHLFIVLPQGRSQGRSRGRSPGRLSIPSAALVERLTSAAKRATDKQITTRLDNKRATRLCVAFAPRGASAFERLTWARKLVAPAAAAGGRVGLLIADMAENDYAITAEALLSALCAASFSLPTFKSGRRSKRLSAALLFDVPERIDTRAINAEAAGNNLARWLTAMPPNMLDAAGYRQIIEQIAQSHGFEYEFIDEARLKKLGAGAFLAVSQGNESRDAGIVKLRYRPANADGPEADGHVALVGKGIVFDTGGNNLKPFRSMLDMHMDMEGSAVALGLLVALSEMRVPYGVDAWLAITENRVSARAYKSQDVVTAANGTTIQVIHTDAEGRMVLADTLALAAKTKPGLIIDYATLTGACVTALTSRYSGVFSNRRNSDAAVIAAGNNSGERVWPFPFDDDFDEGIRSTVADIKQCSEDGSGDHILAARFLSKFVPSSIPWLHVDLSSGQHKGGLAHIPTEYTGFGVRFTIELLENELQLGGSLKGIFSQ